MICISEVNNKERKYCVYWHKNKINGKLYIGMSGNVKMRWQANGVHYNTCRLFYRAISKYGWDSFEHTIIKDGLTKKEAQDLEIELIAKYKTQNPKFGYNLTSGGEGCPELPRNRGKDHHSSKPVYQYDLDGNFIRVWENALCVERELNILATDIYQVAKGKLYIAGGYIWKYELLDYVTPYHLMQYRNIPVCQIDKNLDLVATFTDVYQVDGTSLSRQHRPYNIIVCCLRNRVEYGGYYWCFERDYDDFQQYLFDRVHNRKTYCRKTINQYDENYNLVSTYESTTDVFKKTGIPKSTIKGYCGRGQANHGFKNTGYYWYYAEDMKGVIPDEQNESKRVS